MRLIIIRHGKAADREAFAKGGQPDAKRPLTKAGRRRMKAAARGLRAWFPRIRLLATSPLRRAVQTADLLAKAYDDEPEFVELTALSPGKRPAAMLDWLRAQGSGADDEGGDAHATIAVVGHEPHLGGLVGYLCGDGARAPVVLKKGAACVLEFPASIEPGSARIAALLQPAHLRGLKR